HPNLSTYKADDHEEENKKNKKKKQMMKRSILIRECTHLLTINSLMMKQIKKAICRLHCFRDGRNVHRWRHVIPQIILILDIFFNSILPLFFGERAEAELSELIEFPTVVPRFVIMKDLYQKPFLYPMMGDMFD
ncbi:hypothetical protein Tco_1512862, partial [Tanacetum coccineum]